MDHDSPLPRITTYTYSMDGRLIGVTDDTGGGEKPADASHPPRLLPSSFTSRQYPEKRVLLLSGPDGKTEVFRDNPTRYLSVAQDSETGEMKPVMKYGRPTYLWLCREEREER
jgi:hypothetical protein